MRVWTALVGVLAVVAGPVACGGGGGLAAPAAGALVVQSGLAVASRTETFVDTHHPTAANGGFPELASRTLVTTIVFPTGVAGPFPLIVFSHGFTGSPAYYGQLLRAWAGAGYVVAAPAFPLTNGDAPGGATQNDVVNQPGDVTFVVTSMLRLSDDPNSPWHGLIDRRHIAAAGHSAGAATTIGVALNTCCRDYRITAAVILSGGAVVFPFGSYPAPEATPVLFLHGTNDEAIPYASGLNAYLLAHPPKFFVTLEGSNHNQPTSGDPARPDVQVVTKATLDFFDRYLKGNADALVRLGRDSVRPGTASLQEVEH